MQQRHRRGVIAAIAVVLIAAGSFVVYGRGIWYPLFLQIRGVRTVADVLTIYGPDARKRLAPHFRRAGVSYPPKRIAILVFKEERRLTLWAANADGRWRFIRHYPILAASGHAGPKLREGDYQVPEGVYRIEHLNPNSSYHLSMKVSYPNEFDRQKAKLDGRTRLGGDIFIHGNRVSIGCVAVGDPAIEELFTLVAETGHPRVHLVIAPNDLRTAGPIFHEDAPRWAGELYRTVKAALVPFPVTSESNASVDVTGWSKAKVKPISKSAP